MDAEKPEDRRYVVSDIGYAYAVHDTGEVQDYEHPAGRDKAHPSRNAVNGRILEVAPTFAEAKRIADELNRKAELARP